MGAAHDERFCLITHVMTDHQIENAPLPTGLRKHAVSGMTRVFLDAAMLVQRSDNQHLSRNIEGMQA